jgi:hypothetical protein
MIFLNGIEKERLFGGPNVFAVRNFHYFPIFPRLFLNLFITNFDILAPFILERNSLHKQPTYPLKRNTLSRSKQLISILDSYTNLHKQPIKKKYFISKQTINFNFGQLYKSSQTTH